MVKIVATQKLPYGSKHYAAGEEFEASDKDARLLVKIGRAAHVQVAHHAPAAVAATPPEPASPEVQEAAQEAPDHPRTYSRRDMQAAPAGQTGPAKSSPSSRRGRPPKAKT